MIATERSRLSSFAEKLRSPGREEGQRMKDLQNAIELVTEHLVILNFPEPIDYFLWKGLFATF